jgi:hypothetical protein
LCFTAKWVGGAPREDGTETKEIRWVAPGELAQLNIHPSMRMRIEHALDETRKAPYLG